MQLHASTRAARALSSPASLPPAPAPLPQRSCAADQSSRLHPATLRRCSPYPRHCTFGRTTSFEVPAALRQLTRLDVEITVRGYGSLSPVGRPEERTEVTMWCHKYRKARPRRGASDVRAPSGGGTSTARRRWWLRWLPARGEARGGSERSKLTEANTSTEVRLSWLLALPMSWVLVALPLSRLR